MRKPLTLLLVLLGALLACKRGAPGSSGGAGKTSAPEAMTESYVSKNGLITVHYPATFAGKTVGTSGILLSRSLPDGLDEAIVFTPIEQPISDEVREFARVVAAAESKELNGYIEESSLSAQCAGKPGIEMTGTWQSKLHPLTYLRKACYFIDNGHGYAINYSVPSTLAAQEEPTLRAIREGTQFNR